MSASEVGLRRTSRAQHSTGIIRSIWAVYWRRTAQSGCCARGVVPHAPSRKGGMYVTGGVEEGILPLVVGVMVEAGEGDGADDGRGMVSVAVGEGLRVEQGEPWKSRESPDRGAHCDGHFIVNRTRPSDLDWLSVLSFQRGEGCSVGILGAKQPLRRGML